MRLMIARFALVSTLALTAAPLLAEGTLSFRPMMPEGLDEAAMAVVTAVQEGTPAQLGMYAESGYNAWGAFAVPKETVLAPETVTSWLVVVANTPDEAAANATVLDICTELTGKECTVIGLLAPAE